MSGAYELYGKYTSLISSIHSDLGRWQCIHGELPDAIFLSGEARYLLGRDLQVRVPNTFATQQLYPVTGPIQPPVREYCETLFGIPVYKYHAEGVEYYLAEKGVLYHEECCGL